MTFSQYDIVIITMSRWDGAVSSAILSLAKELATRRRVYYIDHPYSYKDLISQWSMPELRDRRSHLLRGKTLIRPVPGTPDAFRALTPPLTLPVNWLEPGPLYEAGSRYNDRLLNRALASLIAREKISRYIFMNSFDPFFFRQVQQRVKPLLRVYQSRDDISQEEYIARHGMYLEPEQLRAADLRLATSSGLQKKLQQAGLHVENLPNAADTDLFEQALKPGKAPADWPLEDQSRPVIGYIGNLSSLRLDYPLLNHLVSHHRDKDFVFIGSGRFEDEQLARQNNVHLLGTRALVSLPDYLRVMQVAIIPFLCNTLTSSIYPLKINEYLAAGKPVISTAFSQDVRSFDGIISLAETREEFSQAIDYALSAEQIQDTPRRVEWARQNSWTRRALDFERMVEERLKSPSI